MPTSTQQAVIFDPIRSSVVGDSTTDLRRLLELILLEQMKTNELLEKILNQSNDGIL